MTHLMLYMVFSTFANSAQADGVVVLNPNRIQLRILNPASAFPTRFYASKKFTEKSVLELNGKGLYEGDQLLCGWPNGSYDSKQEANMVLGYSNLEFIRAGKYEYKACPTDQPVKSTWGDNGLGAAALFIEVDKIEGDIAETHGKKSSLFMPLKSLKGNYRIEPKDEFVLVKNLQDKKLVQFINSMKACLLSGKEACIETLVPKRFYFPEKTDFGCRSNEKEAGYITASEFSRCVYKSIPNESASLSWTLKEALMHCFNDPSAKWQSNTYIQPNGGYACHISLKEDHYQLESVSPGC